MASAFESTAVPGKGTSLSPTLSSETCAALPTSITTAVVVFFLKTDELADESQDLKDSTWSSRRATGW
jgi:hypothetical protein